MKRIVMTKKLKEALHLIKELARAGTGSVVYNESLDTVDDMANYELLARAGHVSITTIREGVRRITPIEKKS